MSHKMFNFRSKQQDHWTQLFLMDGIKHISKIYSCEERTAKFCVLGQNSTITPSLQDHWTQLFLMDGSPQEKHMNEEEK